MEKGGQSVLKAGEIFVQNKGLLKSSWVTKYGVLYGRTAEQHGCMDVYDDYEAFQTAKTKGKKCMKIELQHVKSIRTSRECTSKGEEYQIEIRLKYQKHILMCKTEADFNDWFSKLNQAADISEQGSGEGSSVSVEQDDSDTDDDEVVVINQMYASTEQAQRFIVDVEPSALAKLCGIEGKMTLLLSNLELAFEDPNTNRVKYAFQMSWMRRFGKIKACNFNFEVGRKCPNGQGTITCLTDHAKAIHKLVSAKSSSRGKTVIPHSHEENNPENNKHAKKSPKQTEERAPDLPPVQAERSAGPVVSTGMARRHPGQKNLPNLVPIKQGEESNPSPVTPTTPPTADRRGSKNKSSAKSKDQENKPLSVGNSGHSRSVSYKTAVDPKFTKELEEKLQEPVVSGENGKGHEPKKEDSVKTREDKKKEKEEKKRREKEEKERKQREKEEKERQEKERKQREKEEKKLSKIKDGEKSKPKSSVKRGQNIYDEAELDTPPATAYGNEDAGPLYDEATSPRQNVPAEYATPVKRKSGKATIDDLYDDGSSTTRVNRHSGREAVEYAEPYQKKGGVPVSQQPVTYAEVNPGEGRAWLKYGAEERFHEEDYSNIKSARAHMNQQEPPPLPVKTYDNDDTDDTYDKVGVNSAHISKGDSQNLYGTASAKQVGDLSGVVQIPEKDYSSDSEGEENMYDDPQYEDTGAGEIQKDQPKNNVSDAYEEAVVQPVVKSAPPKRSHKEVLYEEIS